MGFLSFEILAKSDLVFEVFLARSASFRYLAHICQGLNDPGCSNKSFLERDASYKNDFFKNMDTLIRKSLHIDRY